MALRDFITERRVVTHSGRRFVVTKPSCEAVTLALSRLGGTILACRGAFIKSPHLFTGDLVATFLPFFSDTPALAEVLASCVNLHGGAPGETEAALEEDSALREKIVRALVEVSDLGRIVSLLDLDDLARKLTSEPETGAPGEIPEPGKSGPSPMELLCVGLAERYGCSPFGVMGWPYEAVMSIAVEILPMLQPRSPDHSERIFGKTRAEWEADGVILDVEH